MQYEVEHDLLYAIDQQMDLAILLALHSRVPMCTTSKVLCVTCYHITQDCHPCIRSKNKLALTS